jgi:hypothetical protein
VLWIGQNRLIALRAVASPRVAWAVTHHLHLVFTLVVVLVVVMVETLSFDLGPRTNRSQTGSLALTLLGRAVVPAAAQVYPIPG